MPGTVIFQSFNNGYPGTYAEQPDKIAITAANSGDVNINFGDPVFGLNGDVAAVGATGLTPTAANFKGVAEAHVQTANAYNPQSLGAYVPNQAVPVFERGGICVSVSNATVNPPIKDGPVYVRIGGATTGKPIGGFEAATDTTTYTATVTTQTNNSASIVVSSVANLALGMTVSGTGIPAGAVITVINATTNTITISLAATSAASSGTLTFSGNTVLISNATWGSHADANGVAMLVLKSRNNS